MVGGILLYAFINLLGNLFTVPFACLFVCYFFLFFCFIFFFFFILEYNLLLFDEYVGKLFSKPGSLDRKAQGA